MLRVGQLFGTIESYTEPPMRPQTELTQLLTRQLNAVIANINKLNAETVPALNRQIEAAGAAPLKASDAIAPLQ